MKNIVNFALIGISFIFLSGCEMLGFGNKYPPIPKSHDASLKDMEYKLSPLDEIDIFVWRSPELSTKVSIRPDGKISIPLIEDLTAADKTPTILAREIEQILSTYVKDPLVTVIVSRFQGSTSQQIRVVGQTKLPASIPYSHGLTILDVIIAVGGLKDFADGNAATLSRNSADGTRKTYSLNLDDLIRDGDIEQNAPVMPGDVIIIPETVF